MVGTKVQSLFWENGTYLSFLPPLSQDSSGVLLVTVLPWDTSTPWLKQATPLQQRTTASDFLMPIFVPECVENFIILRAALSGEDRYIH